MKNGRSLLQNGRYYSLFTIHESLPTNDAKSGSRTASSAHSSDY